MTCDHSRASHRALKDYAMTYRDLAAWCETRGIKAPELAEKADLNQDQAKRILGYRAYPGHEDDGVPWCGTARLWQRLWREREKDTGVKCAQCGTIIAVDRSTRKFCSGRCRVEAHRGKVPTGPSGAQNAQETCGS
jgi:hypothetical protein